MKKKIPTILIITALVVSLGLNAWNYGYKVAYQRGFNDGTQAVSNAVMTQVQNEGKISVTIDDKVVAFVPENRSIGSSTLTDDTVYFE